MLNVLYMNDELQSAEGAEQGASMVEYALLVVLIALLAIVAITLAGEELSGSYSDIASSLDAAN